MWIKENKHITVLVPSWAYHGVFYIGISTHNYSNFVNICKLWYDYFWLEVAFSYEIWLSHRSTERCFFVFPLYKVYTGSTLYVARFALSARCLVSVCLTTYIFKNKLLHGYNTRKTPLTCGVFSFLLWKIKPRC